MEITPPKLLEISSLEKSFEGIVAVNRCTFSVEDHSMVGLIGPNGAGKSVTFNMICGLLKSDGGQVRFKGEVITGLPPNEVAGRGIGRTFQDVRIFPRMKVIDNVMLALQHKALWRSCYSLLWSDGPFHTRPRDSLDVANAMLEEVGLFKLRDEPAGSLSYGQRKLLEFANVMSLKPSLVLLDEPMAGVNPAKVDQILEKIMTWHERGTSFIIVEHNMKVIMTACRHIVVLAEGTVIAEGNPDEIQSNQRVIDAYFGAAR